MQRQHTGRQMMAELRRASDELELELRKHLVPGVTLERLPTGEMRIRAEGLEWVGTIARAPAELGNVLMAVGADQSACDAVRALKLRNVPRRPSSD